MSTSTNEASAEAAELVRSTVADVTHHIDRKSWEALRALYADTVRVDYTSLFGGTAESVAGDALIAGWRSNLQGVVTQHLLGPIVVELQGTRAHARCHVRAYHESGRAVSGSNWEVLGHYVFELGREGSRWEITSMTLETFAQLGNTKLLQESAR